MEEQNSIDCILHDAECLILVRKMNKWGWVPLPSSGRGGVAGAPFVCLHVPESLYPWFSSSLCRRHCWLPFQDLVGFRIMRFLVISKMRCFLLVLGGWWGSAMPRAVLQFPKKSLNNLVWKLVSTIIHNLWESSIL